MLKYALPRICLARLYCLLGVAFPLYMFMQAMTCLLLHIQIVFSGTDQVRR